MSALEDARVGEQVVLMGRDGEESITAAQVGDAAGSFSYEFVSGIGPRVSRVYYYNGKPITVVNRLISK